SSLLLNLYSKFGPAQTLRCNVSVGFFNIMQLFMSLCLEPVDEKSSRGIRCNTLASLRHSKFALIRNRCRQGFTFRNGTTIRRMPSPRETQFRYGLSNLQEISSALSIRSQSAR